jgi:hypothetical protein
MLGKEEIMRIQRAGNIVNLTYAPKEELNVEDLQQQMSTAKDDESIFRISALFPADMFYANEALLREIFVEVGHVNNGETIFIRMERVFRTQGNSAGTLAVSAPMIPPSPLERAAIDYYKMTRQPITEERLAYLNSLGKQKSEAV